MDYSSGTIEIDGTEFQLNPSGAFLPAEPPTDGTGPIVSLRSPEMVEQIAALKSATEVRRIFELGIWRGGSTALIEAMFKPEALAAVELRTERAAVLDHYIDTRGLGAVVHPHYGIDQADVPTILRIARETFGDEPIDLVIDDASHRYEQTKTSFTTLFPLLRPGGRYVIEDWNWSVMLHNPAVNEGWKSSLTATHDLAQPMSALIAELVVATVTAPVIAAVTVTNEMAIIERGEGDLEPGFDLDALQVVTPAEVFLRG